MAAELDQRFSKRQIFELYANDIYLGNRGSFAIRGFGEAAQAYFGKDIREISAGEAAFLAGMIRAPNRYSAAERHPDRAEEARDRVLTQMAEDSYITAEQESAAKNATLKFVSGGVSSSSSPYFVDMVKDHLLEKFSESDLANQSYRIYTTLDPNLQRAATQAVQIGIQGVDKLLARRYAAWKKQGQAPAQAQVAVVVLDPHTGEIRALIGGRDYGQSQLNHALAHRQPGSVFKPFVYAAAFDNAIEGMQPVVTPVTTVDDIPTTFDFDGKEYTPDNYGQEFYGTVTVRDALIHSLNVATVKVAELIGYQRVVDVARQMGLGSNIKATPAVALGAYEMTPMDVAAGYTAFAANGVRVRTHIHPQGRYRRWQDCGIECSAVAAGARSSRRVPHHEPHGGCDQSRHRLSGSRAGIQRARRGKDRHVARRLVCRLHVKSPLRGVGGLRRQSQSGPGRRQHRRADLGRVHETRGHPARRTGTRSRSRPPRA